MSLSFRGAVLAVAFSLVICIPSSTIAQQTSDEGSHAGPPHRLPPDYRMTNLQVLPKDIPQRELIAQMRQYMGALGVRCAFCHEDNEQTHLLNFAADTKPQKQTARIMIGMVNELNQKYLATLPTGDAKVTCYTCHRGRSIPESQPAPPAGTTPSGGTPAQ